MGANSFGRFFTLTSFGESRSAGVGAVIDGCPAGIPLFVEDIQKELNRRKPKNSFDDGDNLKKVFSTSRNEDDICEILSGVFESKTLGSPIAVLVRNKETSSKDYDNLKDVFRPGHADYAYDVKYGHRDYRGGGRSSGRETIGRVIGGAVAKKMLEAFAVKEGQNPIEVKVRAEEIAGLRMETPLREDDDLPEAVLKKLSDLASEGNSAGCILSCSVLNVPEGLGSPVFGKLDAVLSQAIMSIGAVKGIEIGGGFYSASIPGSENNELSKNYSGGIMGGISCNMENLLNYSGEDTKRGCFTGSINFKLAVKPVPSIRMSQTSLNKEGEKCMLSIGGNHDICLFPRIVPVVEAMTYLVLADAFLASKVERF
ncbi:MULTISPECIES: chorismate synthase [unclassified Treponema]|uniref:chorismate synthase n=1 Tax=unclassified Treponema TaxID=2638727 RepID=UPI0020A34AF2|nr:MULTISPECIES: chorismate synthase [unclassified Treponema]UTC65905.1 chorismate synthase [Treponema sp. OMZ 789]UTC68633.1 chorismate synthase [Treponema sp. OMZ 790]UTC71363.1 chorismate synthase [Treponema sp. OMZ 791]